MINAHTHIFTDQDIPDKFLPLGLVKVLRTGIGYKVFSGLLRNIWPFSNKDGLDRVMNFVQAGRMGSQKEIFFKLSSYYPEQTKFIVLAMDMLYMGAGRVPRAYEEQLEEVDQLFRHNDSILPFIHIDIRRPEHEYLLKRYLIEKDWPGVKMYPPLGVFPQDERNDIVYDYCVQLNKPIVAHCTYGNPVHWKGSKAELKELLGNKYDSKASRKENCNKFTDPQNWIEVVKKHPDLKICLAHGGGMDQWHKWLTDQQDESNLLNQIKLMCKMFDNIYMDISYTLSNKKLIPLLKLLLQDKILREKILFGSDYYMNLNEGEETEWSIDLRASLGEKDFKKIADENVKQFLYG